jgi:hypothetical protein
MRKKEPDNPKETPPFEDDLRSDLIPGTQAVPDRSLFRERLTILTPSRVISLIIVLVFFFIGWLLFAGPMKPTMEKLLTKLSERVSTPTENYHNETATAVPIKPTSEPILPSQTPTQIIPSNTPLSSLIETKPTFTPTDPPTPPTVAASRTPTFSPSVTSTATVLPTASVAGCVQAAGINSTDVGKTLCVIGHVLRTESKPNSFLIILENPKDAFYFLSYDRKWENLEEGKCVFATGKIMQLGNNPVMILDYKIPLEYCP